MLYSNNTLVCINPDATLSVLLSMYQSRYNSLSNSILSTRELKRLTVINVQKLMNIVIYIYKTHELGILLDLLQRANWRYSVETRLEILSWRRVGETRLE